MIWLQQIYLPQGRMLGGSNSFNYLLYSRGNRADYDDWAGPGGCEGWSYEQVLPYFIKAEAMQNVFYRGSGKYCEKKINVMGLSSVLAS